MMCLKIFLKHSLVPFACSYRKATFSGFKGLGFILAKHTSDMHNKLCDIAGGTLMPLSSTHGKHMEHPVTGYNSSSSIPMAHTFFLPLYRLMLPSALRIS
jgi:hypothetical protein